VHHLQGETDFVTPADQLKLLQDLHRETLGLFTALQARARSVAAYDANNAYQQVLGRQEVHLQWLADAIAALGGTPADAPGAAGSAEASEVAAQQACIDRWAPRVEMVTNARHRTLLRLILGEMREHLRVLQQAAEGRTDVLGRHADGKVLRGTVMATRPGN
jgi:hypothetical protein